MKIFIFTLFITVSASITIEDLQYEIGSRVLFSNRVNSVLIAVSKDCSIDKFISLVQNYINVEKQVLKKAANFDVELVVVVSIGGKRRFKIQNESDLEKYLTDTNIYNESIVTNFESLIPHFVPIDTGTNIDEVDTSMSFPRTKYCGDIARKEYTLVVSDMCLSSINDQLLNIKGGSLDMPFTYCQKDYRHAGLMLHTSTEVDDCVRHMTNNYFDEIFLPPLYMDIFESSNAEKYLNMKVMYYSAPRTSKINLFVLANDTTDISYELIQKIALPDNLCKDGSFYAQFYYFTDNGLELTNNIRMAFPLYFNENNSKSFIIRNFGDRMLQNFYQVEKTRPTFEQKDCNNLQSILTNLNNSPVNDDQYNILILQDPYPSCMNFQLKWENTNRHLEIIVLYSEIIKSNYSNFILFSSQKQNHLTFFNISNSSRELFEHNTICKSKTPSKLYDSFSEVNTPDSNPSLTSEPLPSTTILETTSSTITTTLTSTSLSTSLPFVSETSTTQTISTSTSEPTSNLFSTSDPSDQTTSMTGSEMSNNKNLNEQLLPPEDTLSKFLNWYMVVGILLLLIILIVICIKLVLMLNASRKLRDLKIQLKNRNGFETQSTKKYWKIFLDDNNVIIQFDCILGKGSNATVYKALVPNKNPFNLLSKTLKIVSNNFAAIKIPNEHKTYNTKMFLKELDILTSLKPHPNIITILGWTFYGDIPVMMTELAKMNLLTYVQTVSKHQNFIKFSLQVLWQISNALAYIASQKMIHRDVACRNILLMDENQVKLADFDLCCYCDKNGIYKDSMQGKLPFKWLSIEALINGIFSEMSDVWAFGVLCYELFSYGNIPYGSMPPEEMLAYLQADNRLERPFGTPDYIYDLMLNCWAKEPLQRPSFMQINKIITLKLENETFKYGYLTLKKILVKKQ